MRAYLNLLQTILDHGVDRGDRTGTGTRAIFGYQIRHDLATGFPLLTTKKLHVRSIVGELLWFLRGESSVAFLRENKITIWDEWADASGDLGPVYGVQWRAWQSHQGEPIDQVSLLIKGLRETPNSRRHILSAWNVADLPDESISPQANVAQGRMALAPCHVMYQFFVANGRLSCMLTQRSADCFLGLPFNLASVAFLTHMLAQQCDLEVGEIIHSLGDAHLYQNHISQAKEQLTREPLALPRLNLRRRASIFDYEIADFELVDYQAHAHISAPISI